MRLYLDKRITLDRRVTTQDATYGAAVESWAVFATCWAEVQDVLPSRSESVRQGLAQARSQTRIRIRYRAGVDSSMRVRFDGRTLQIIGGPAEIGGRKEYLELVCEAYTTAGGA